MLDAIDKGESRPSWVTVPKPSTLSLLKIADLPMFVP
jgi:hypothetical protein